MVWSVVLGKTGWGKCEGEEMSGVRGGSCTLKKTRGDYL